MSTPTLTGSASHAAREDEDEAKPIFDLSAAATSNSDMAAAAAAHRERKVGLDLYKGGRIKVSPTDFNASLGRARDYANVCYHVAADWGNAVGDAYTEAWATMQGVLAEAGAADKERVEMVLGVFLSVLSGGVGALVAAGVERVLSRVEPLADGLVLLKEGIGVIDEEVLAAAEADVLDKAIVGAASGDLPAAVIGTGTKAAPGSKRSTEIPAGVGAAPVAGAGAVGTDPLGFRDSMSAKVTAERLTVHGMIDAWAIASARPDFVPTSDPLLEVQRALVLDGTPLLMLPPVERTKLKPQFEKALWQAWLAENAATVIIGPDMRGFGTKAYAHLEKSDVIWDHVRKFGLAPAMYGAVLERRKKEAAAINDASEAADD